MAQTTKHDWALLPWSLALGGAVLVAFGLADRWSAGAVGFVVVAGLGAYTALGKSEWAVAQSDRGDERQSGINREAMVWSYYAVITVAVPGFLWEVASGSRPGAFTLVCTVGGFTHMSAVAVLRRRR